MLPLYEAKMFHQFDHRWATYDGAEVRDVSIKEKQDASFVALPRYWVADAEVERAIAGRWFHEWVLVWRDIARATDVRTTIATVLGSGASPEGGALLMLLARGAVGATALLGVLNSFVFDFAARQKVGGTHLKFFTMRQLPMPSPEAIADVAPWDHRTSIEDWIRSRVTKLTATSADMTPFVRELGHSTATWGSHARATLRAEIDAAAFLLFGVADDDADYILDSFPIVRRKDEAAFGSYVTKERILSALEEMREASRTGIPYLSSALEREGPL